VAHFAEKFEHSPEVKGTLSGIRPVVIGLIASAVLFFAEMSIFTASIPFDYIFAKITGTASALPEFGIRWQGAVIFAVALILSGKFKINVIWTIIISAILGMLLMSV
jgi:chromate transporter